MTSKKSHVVYNQRRKVLNHARDLARSGEHADHQTIIPHLVAHLLWALAFYGFR